MAEKVIGLQQNNFLKLRRARGVSAPTMSPGASKSQARSSNARGDFGANRVS
jgi:hypothetical protein